ncbi:YybH family protein [Pedobacter caeni]|uniref:Ketosteroid isomerase homolog n=1 Tax=Pedobacter caeni TaxID=288992 RepID=A0A1M5DJ60_9SPHI|nr:DUF4440 domain-containing protein [Pedobacter caeni]SHF67049.1 Ketosteroid isomerase homolog [Pedobacter caeni]
MKKLILILFIGLGLSVKAQKGADQQSILSLLEKQRSAWNEGNLENFMEGYWKNDSLLFVGKSGPTYGWQQTMDNYKKGYPDKSAMGTLTFNIKKVELLSKDTAFVLGGWHLKREKDEPQGYFTLILRKIKGVWQVVSDHSS